MGMEPPMLSTPVPALTRNRVSHRVTFLRQYAAISVSLVDWYSSYATSERYQETPDNPAETALTPTSTHPHRWAFALSLLDLGDGLVQIRPHGLERLEPLQAFLIGSLTCRDRRVRRRRPEQRRCKDPDGSREIGLRRGFDAFGAHAFPGFHVDRLRADHQRFTPPRDRPQHGSVCRQRFRCLERAFDVLTLQQLGVQISQHACPLRLVDDLERFDLEEIFLEEQRDLRQIRFGKICTREGQDNDTRLFLAPGFLGDEQRY